MERPAQWSFGATIPAKNLEATGSSTRASLNVRWYRRARSGSCIDLVDANGIAEVEGSKGAWFKDPEGNILSLTDGTIQELGPAVSAQFLLNGRGDKVRVDFELR
jgi:hypothetical protein